MLFVREFEIIADEGGYLAVPFDMDGGTEGKTREEAVAMAADWLRASALDSLLHGYALPGGTVGHEPREDGWGGCRCRKRGALRRPCDDVGPGCEGAWRIDRPRRSDVLDRAACLLEGWLHAHGRCGKRGRAPCVGSAAGKAVRSRSKGRARVVELH